jgi:LysM repeat protein
VSAAVNDSGLPKTGKQNTIGLVGSLVVCTLLLVPSPASALRYKPKPDETLGHIAKMHYGHSRKQIYLMTTNRITDPKSIHSRKTLWIPTVWRYKIKRGDGLAKIAKKYLKSSSRAEFLMWLNRIDDPKSIEAGKLITVTFLIRHRVQEGDKIVDMS